MTSFLLRIIEYKNFPQKFQISNQESPTFSSMRMPHIVYVLLILCLWACSENKSILYEELDIQYSHEIPFYEYNGSPFTGTALEAFSDWKIEHYIKTGVETMQLGYYKNGERERELLFENGKKNGPSKMWWPNGAILLEEQYSDGDLNGEVKRYNPEGRIEETKTYVNGMLEIEVDSL